MTAISRTPTADEALVSTLATYPSAHPFGYATAADHLAYCVFHWRLGDCPPQRWWLRQIRKWRRVQRRRLK